MVKVTVLYQHPIDAEAFERYYSETHVPLVDQAPNLLKAEYTKFLPNPDGSPTEFYRMADLYFESSELLQQTLSLEQGKAMADDLANFATGGAIVLIGTVEN